MKEYRVINGNLLDAKEDYIAHQVNCQGVMGSGVAKAIRDKHSEVYKEYTKFVKAMRDANRQILGTAQIVYVQNNEVCDTYKGVINLFAQDKFGNDGKQYTSLGALKNALTQVNNYIIDESIAFPWLMSCVRGGANWEEVLPLICETLTNASEIVFYKL